MGNNHSKLDEKYYPTALQRKCFHDFQYVHNKTLKASSVKKKVSDLWKYRIMMCE